MIQINTKNMIINLIRSTISGSDQIGINNRFSMVLHSLNSAANYEECNAR